jgi:hypothetical protein
VIPASARLRSDVHYRLIDDPRITSPIIMSNRLNDNAWYIAALKEMVAAMYAENPPWLDVEHNLFPDTGDARAATAAPRLPRGNKPA